jgi:peptidylprolyl isomerase
MSQAKSGDTVRVHYQGTLDDGAEFDSSAGREPLQFTVGSGQVIAGFDGATIGMAVGEKKTVNIPCGEAYGAHDPEQVREIERGQIPDNVDLTPGAQLQASTPDGQQLLLTVVSTTDAMVTLDANHPLAGKDLTFEIELVEIV